MTRAEIFVRVGVGGEGDRSVLLPNSLPGSGNGSCVCAAWRPPYAAALATFAGSMCAGPAGAGLRVVLRSRFGSWTRAGGCRGERAGNATRPFATRSDYGRTPCGLLDNSAVLRASRLNGQTSKVLFCRMLALTKLRVWRLLESREEGDRAL